MTNGCFQKSWYPQIIQFNRVFHYKPSILGYLYFWKHPNGYVCFCIMKYLWIIGLHGLVWVSELGWKGNLCVYWFSYPQACLASGHSGTSCLVPATESIDFGGTMTLPCRNVLQDKLYATICLQNSESFFQMSLTFQECTLQTEAAGRNRSVFKGDDLS